MEKYEFIEYTAKRYGIDESVAETMVDMFADSMQDILNSGQSVNIDELGEFQSTPLASLFPQGLNHRNNIALAKAGRRNIVSFKASDNLTQNAA